MGYIAIKPLKAPEAVWDGALGGRHRCSVLAASPDLTVHLGQKPWSARFHEVSVTL